MPPIPQEQGGARYKDVNEAADYLRSSKSTLDKLRGTGNGPRFSKIGKRVIYDITDLDAYAERNKRASTSEIIEATVAVA